MNFYMADSAGNPVNTAVQADFTVKLILESAIIDHTVASLNFTITFMIDGWYLVAITPTSFGTYQLRIKHPTYNPQGWADQFSVETVVVPENAKILSTLDDLSTSVSQLKTQNSTIITQTSDISSRSSGGLYTGARLR